MEWIAWIFMKEKIYARIFEEAKHYHIYIKKTKYFQQSLNINLQNNDRNSLKSKKKNEVCYIYVFICYNELHRCKLCKQVINSLVEIADKLRS